MQPTPPTLHSCRATHANMPPTLARYPCNHTTLPIPQTLARHQRKHSTHATHASTLPTPLSLAQIARHFSNSHLQNEIILFASMKTF